MFSRSYSKKDVSICLLFVVAAVCVLITQVKAAKPYDIAIGAIRWDCWIGDLWAWKCVDGKAKMISEMPTDSRMLTLPAGKILKRVKITTPSGTTGTVIFTDPNNLTPGTCPSHTNNSPQSFPLAVGTFERILNWSEPSEEVWVELDTSTSAANISFDDFVIGNPEVMVTTFDGIPDGTIIYGWKDGTNGIYFYKGHGLAIENSLSPGPNYIPETLDPNGYHHRVPFYGEEPQGPLADVVKARLLGSDIPTWLRQENMDKEIGYAKDFGLDYWAFLFYGYGYNDPVNANPLGEALALYLASTRKNDINYCFRTYALDDICYFE